MTRRRKRQQSPFSRKLLYFCSHILCAAIVILVFLTLVQCTIKKPEAPSWNTNLTVPLANNTWVMSEIIEKIDQENLTVDSLGNPIFFYHEILDTIAINGSFVIEDFTQTFAESLGVVELPAVDPTSFQIALSSQIPSIPPGIFPDMSFDIDNPLPPLGDFSSATISSGTARIQIDNHFGLYLDTVIITINDDVNSQQVTSYAIPGGIPSGNSAINHIDLAGKTISDQLSVNIHCHAQEQTSFTLSGKTLNASLGMPDGLSVSSAIAKVPQIDKSFSANIELNCEHQIESALLETGNVSIDITNNTNISADIILELPDIRNGTTIFQISENIPAQQTTRLIYDIVGYTIEPLDQTVPQVLDVNIDGIIPSSGDVLVSVDENDDIVVEASIFNISLASATGILAATVADFGTIEQTIDIPTGFDNIELPSAVLTLEVVNTVNLHGSFIIDINGDQGQHKTISGDILPGTPGNPVTTLISDDDLSGFMNPIPDIFTVTGSATFGDGLTSGSINTDDFLVASVTLSSPLEMVIDSTTVDGEWENVDLDIDSSIVNSLYHADFHALFDNHLPVGVTAEILFSNDSASVYTNPVLTLGPIEVPAGSVGAEGYVTASTISEIVLSLDSAQVQILNNDSLWIGEIITLHSTNGTAVTMRAIDYLTLTGYIEIEVTFSDDLWED